MGLTALDIFLVLLVVAGLVFGFLRGFVFEVLTLFAWVAAVLALSYFHAPVAEWLYEPVGTRAGAATLAFALVFGIVFVAFKLLSRRIGRRVRGSVVGPVDRILGAGFGALKGLIAVTLLYLAANLLYDTLWGRAAERPEWMTQSRSYPLLQSSGETIVEFIEYRRGEKPDPDGSAEETE